MPLKDYTSKELKEELGRREADDEPEVWCDECVNFKFRTAKCLRGFKKRFIAPTDMCDVLANEWGYRPVNNPCECFRNNTTL